MRRKQGKAAKKNGPGGARKGAGRPAHADPPTPIAAKVPASLAKRLDARARKLGLSRSAAIARAVGEWVG